MVLAGCVASKYVCACIFQNSRTFFGPEIEKKKKKRKKRKGKERKEKDKLSPLITGTICS